MGVWCAWFKNYLLLSFLAYRLNGAVNALINPEYLAH